MVQAYKEAKQRAKEEERQAEEELRLLQESTINLLNPSSRRLMWMITGSGFKPIALHVYVPKSFALGVMGKMVFPVFYSVPSDHFQVTSSGGNPPNGQQIVVDTPLLAL